VPVRPHGCAPQSLDRYPEWEQFGALAPCKAQIVSLGSQRRGWRQGMTTRSTHDKDGKPTDDQSLAERGEVVEIDDQGVIVTTYPGLSWKVDPISLDGDEGELATRPTKPSRSA
jgi:Mind bomb SH3 repeat domain